MKAKFKKGDLVIAYGPHYKDKTTLYQIIGLIKDIDEDTGRQFWLYKLKPMIDRPAGIFVEPNGAIVVYDQEIKKVSMKEVRKMFVRALRSNTFIDKSLMQKFLK